MASDKAHELQQEADALMKKISPILAGHDPDLQGYVCADLLAIHIAGWPPEARDEMLAMVIDLVKSLVPFYGKQMEIMRKTQGSA